MLSTLLLTYLAGALADCYLRARILLIRPPLMKCRSNITWS